MAVAAWNIYREGFRSFIYIKEKEFYDWLLTSASSQHREH
jgi:hypothetical protein